MTETASVRAAATIETVFVLAVAYFTRDILRHWDVGFAAGAVATIVTVSLATWLLRRRGSGWRELGFRRPQRMRPAVLWAAALFLAAMFVIPAIVAVISNAFHFPAQRLDAFASLRGNLAFYLVLLIPVAWGTAGFGEELIFRGFVLRRLTDVLGGGRKAELGAVLMQATLFGLGHAYLGPRGILNAGALGLLWGLSYAFNGRNLWPLIVAHGLVDTVGITLLYLGTPHS